MTVQELKKIFDRLVNSGRGEYEALDACYYEALEEEDIEVDDDLKRVSVG